MAQEPGWSSSPFASGISPKDAWSRKIYGNIGGRNDDVFAYSDQEDRLMNRTLGASLRSRGGSGGGGSDWLGSGSVNMKFGGGNTPSNPGAYNYGTLGRSVSNAVEAVKWGFNTRNRLRQSSKNNENSATDNPSKESAIKAMTTFKNVTNPGGTNVKGGDASGMLAPSNDGGPPFEEGNSPWFNQAMDRLNFDPTAKTRAGFERSWQTFASNQDLANNTPNTRNMPNRSGKFPHVSSILGKKQP